MHSATHENVSSHCTAAWHALWFLLGHLDRERAIICTSNMIAGRLHTNIPADCRQYASMHTMSQSHTHITFNMIAACIHTYHTDIDTYLYMVAACTHTITHIHWYMHDCSMHTITVITHIHYWYMIAAITHISMYQYLPVQDHLHIIPIHACINGCIM